MGEASCHIKVFPLFGDGEGVGKHLVHASMLIAEHSFHLLVGQPGNQVDGPVAEAQERFFCLLVAAIDPCVA